MSYNELREKYLEQLVKLKVLEFDEEDILKNGPSNPNGKSKNSYKKLAIFPALREYLYDDNEEIIRDNLRQILIGPDEAPRSFGGKGEIATMRSVFEQIIFDIEGNSLNISKTAVDVCKEIFNYKRINIVGKKNSESLAYWLQSQLCVKVCPYCNRMYTTTLYGKKRIRPDFDHFYPQSIYPYLAVSLFNLIPSCGICNKAKSDNAEITKDIIIKKEKEINAYKEKKSIIYPYDESYNDLNRHISFRAIFYDNKALMGKSDKFTIELWPTECSKWLEFNDFALVKTELDERFGYTDDEEERAFWNRTKQTIDLLRLERLYNEHKLEIMKILRIHYEYNQVAIQLMTQSLNAYIATAHTDLISIRDLQYFAFLKPEEWGNSPLNKLKSDIIGQLDKFIKNSH